MLSYYTVNESLMGRGIPMSTVCAGIQLDEKSDFPSGVQLLISQKIQHILQLPLHSTITLQLGQKTVSCRVQLFSSAAALVRIRQDIAQQLSIPDGLQLNIQYEPKSKVVRLGPVLGILLSRISRTPEGLFGSASSFCKEIVQSAKGKGILGYIFTLNDLSYENQTVQGWRWKNGGWAQTTMPFPNAIYNRLSSRRQEKSTLIQEHLKKFKEMQIHFFNEQFLNKWEVFQALSQVPQAVSYMPATYLYKGFDTLQATLKRFNQVYLKPTNGSLGRGIYRIRKAGNHYSCQYSTMSGSVKKKFSRLTSLYQSLSPRLSKTPYLVQQGLHLVKLNGNPLDFRSLVQKNHTGKWAVTSIVARSGQNDSIVSNLARGGTILQVGNALAAASPWTTGIRPSSKQLKEVSIQLAKGLESSMEGNFAELGIDLAVDTRGKVWLLEINSKPSKNDDQVLSEGKIRPSVKKLLDYSLYLHGFVRPKSQLKSGMIKSTPKKTWNRKKR
jgi:hypothetical protein